MAEVVRKQTPSEVALAYLRSRVEADGSLPQEVRQAVLADLSSERQSAFQALRGLFAAKRADDGTSDEAESAERSRPAP
jgi:hypothetical protein